MTFRVQIPPFKTDHHSMQQRLRLFDQVSWKSVNAHNSLQQLSLLAIDCLLHCCRACLPRDSCNSTELESRPQHRTKPLVQSCCSRTHGILGFANLFPPCYSCSDLHLRHQLSVPGNNNKSWTNTCVTSVFVGSKSINRWRSGARSNTRCFFHGSGSIAVWIPSSSSTASISAVVGSSGISRGPNSFSSVSTKRDICTSPNHSMPEASEMQHHLQPVVL